jgi:hypothetical protein
VKNFIKGLFLLILVFGMIYIFYILKYETLTPNENTLFSLFLTILSIAATLVVSHIYSESSQEQAIKDVKEYYQSNLHTYALNAAEKVNNLSSELNRLSNYLQDALETQEYDEGDKQIVVYEEKIASAIHSINTLKSVNDTSLSDWKGVIPEELDQKEEERQEREEKLEQIIDKYENIIQTDELESGKKIDQELINELSEIRRAIRYLQNSANIVRIKKTTKPLKQVVENKCPGCNATLVYKQRPNIKGLKIVQCEKCQKQYLSKWNNDKFIMEKEEMITENTICPWCTEEVGVSLSNFPYSSTVISCPECDNGIKVSRGTASLKVVKTGLAKYVKNELNEDIINQVREVLPEQPWPTGIHKIISDKLGLQKSMISSAIAELIKRGIYNPQVNGKIYIPKP